MASSSHSPPIKEENTVPSIIWRKGDLVGSGTFGEVYRGLNLVSGGFLAIKQFSLVKGKVSKEEVQHRICEIEEEVRVLKPLSHTNIVRYLGTAQEEGTFNILLEFVPGGSISQLLKNFGPLPETVIKVYTKQLLKGLEYLHQSKIMHRDIKGANILIGDNACIKLADFGASKEVVESEAITGARSLKGTPHWMAPEVARQSAHGFPGDIWSVGCTVIEMATGKHPWSQYGEVAVLLTIAETTSPPTFPEHLSSRAKDFLSRCLEVDVTWRETASELLKGPASESLGCELEKEVLNKQMFEGPASESLGCELEKEVLNKQMFEDPASESLGCELEKEVLNKQMFESFSSVIGSDWMLGDTDSDRGASSNDADHVTSGSDMGLVGLFDSDRGASSDDADHVTSGSDMGLVGLFDSDRGASSDDADHVTSGSDMSLVGSSDDDDHSAHPAV